MKLRGISVLTVTVALIGILIPNVGWADMMPTVDSDETAERDVVTTQLIETGLDAEEAEAVADGLTADELAVLAESPEQIAVVGASAFSTTDYLITIGVGVAAFAVMIAATEDLPDGILE
jgi:hypothetical protein